MGLWENALWFPKPLNFSGQNRMDNGQYLSRSNPHLSKIVFCRSTTQLSTELDDEAVILDVSSNTYSRLDPVGTTIWNLLEEPITFSNLVEHILNIYDVMEQQCIDDMLIFLRDLAEKNLINISNGRGL
jgi:hypothetical protein